MVAVAALLLAGCGDDAESASPPKTERPAPTSKPSSAAKPSKAYTVEQLAAVVGCKPKSAGKAKDFKEATCTVDGENFVFFQFDKASGQQAWLEYAKSYGGIYLSGNRWVMSGKSKEYLESLRQKLGGQIEEDATR